MYGGMKLRRIQKELSIHTTEEALEKRIAV
jgi:hypothetical protein